MWPHSNWWLFIFISAKLRGDIHSETRWQRVWNKHEQYRYKTLWYRSKYHVKNHPILFKSIYLWRRWTSYQLTTSKWSSLLAIHFIHIFPNSLQWTLVYNQRFEAVFNYHICSKLVSNSPVPLTLITFYTDRVTIQGNYLLSIEQLQT